MLFGFWRQRRRVIYQTGNYPVRSFQVRNVEVSVWLNRDDDGKYHYMLSYNGLYGRDGELRRRAVFKQDVRDVRIAEQKALMWIERGGINT